MAQNGWEPNYGKLPLNPDGQTIDWDAFFLSDEGNNTEDIFAKIRQDITGMDYSTEFMVGLYIQDLQILMKLGYEFPEWATENDVKTVEQYLDNWKWKIKHDPQ